jgi:catechol 2,3-dioxygenase-like lactoylglutathione lyase family enzyme
MHRSGAARAIPFAPERRLAAGRCRAAPMRNFPQVDAHHAGHTAGPSSWSLRMFNHLSIGVRDLGRSRRFYDAALAPLGYTCLSASAGSLGYGRDAVALWISPSEAPVPADPASGLHFCFDAPTRAAVDAFHAGALAHGGGDNGAPGLRPDYDANYYAAFAVDPDGYRIEALCLAPG